MREFFFLLVISLALCDFFLHNPRGSNDRLNEANENRDNGNRLFDSQNNAKGGYCWGPQMSYYEGSLLQVEWAADHGCLGGANCDVVLQYMCGSKNDPPMSRVRDGTSTNSIPIQPTGPNATDPNGELTYGMHESYQYYQACSSRSRNRGLWIADRTITVDTAIGTRQNEYGSRRGYECPEERDYYPYWQPSPWKDIAVITSDTSLCPYYQAESQNVKPRFYCNATATPWPITQADCTVAGGRWLSQPAWGLPAPACQLAKFSRPNDLGGTSGGYNANYQWTLPTAAQESCINGAGCNCVLRVRYNITSGDAPRNLDWTNNAAASPIQDNMYVNVSGNTLYIKTDTSSFGRVFQDRSFTFNIIPRNNIAPSSRIHNLNVKGKRGNMVQTFPAEVYGFVPEILNVNAGDFIHFQWTGCDTNPLGNAGEGTPGTDRSNIVQIQSLNRNIPVEVSLLPPTAVLFKNATHRDRFGYLSQTNCLDYNQLAAKNNNSRFGIEIDPNNCMKLNAAPAYFNEPPIQMTQTGIFYFMSTRNNIVISSNQRLQKGTIVVN